MIYSQSFLFSALREDSSKSNSRGGRRPYIPAHLLVMSHQIFAYKSLSMLRIYPRGNRGQKKQDRYSWLSPPLPFLTESHFVLVHDHFLAFLLVFLYICHYER